MSLLSEILNGRPRRRQNPLPQELRSRPNIQEMALLPYGATGEYARLGDGTASQLTGRTCRLNRANLSSRVRLYSTKTLKLLGTLVHHKQGCQTVTFASHIDRVPLCGDLKEDDYSSDEDEITVEEKHARGRWLIAGSTDAKVSIWALMDFEKTST